MIATLNKKQLETLIKQIKRMPFSHFKMEDMLKWKQIFQALTAFDDGRRELGCYFATADR